VIIILYLFPLPGWANLIKEGKSLSFYVRRFKNNDKHNTYYKDYKYGKKGYRAVRRKRHHFPCNVVNRLSELNKKIHHEIFSLAQKERKQHSPYDKPHENSQRVIHYLYKDSHMPD